MWFIKSPKAAFKFSKGVQVESHSEFPAFKQKLFKLDSDGLSVTKMMIKYDSFFIVLFSAGKL